MTLRITNLPAARAPALAGSCAPFVPQPQPFGASAHCRRVDPRSKGRDEMRTPVLCAVLASVALTGCTTYDDGYYGRRDGYYDRDYAREYREGRYEPYAL